MHKRCLHVDLGWVFMMASLVLSEGLIIQVDCNEDISMKCDAIQDKSYRSITWYKLNNRTGIIRRSDDEKPQFYEYPRLARFGVMDSLVLPRVRPEDAGTYLCLIRANIGQTNRESIVTLNVSTDCVIQTTVAVTAWQNVTHSTLQRTMHVVEVSVIWTLCGFLILGLVKIALCHISMEVVRKIKRRHSRRKQQQCHQVSTQWNTYGRFWSGA
ncbi:uncharacterized protein isoform X2 [Salmo salar]|uniref:Uncharacterized protein isoform X2 n=1 Tax=Salmo salar TaxID=8030 RepID=A0A1S3LMD8_SALSA|nr:uncharacterized protein LOC106567195 isoform X2 [Salmo salar]|eukprot:XP_013991684.1 PREDICTED: uncharacterized protein LOC106567195 isoform X2 [Salmo salar]